MPWYAIALLGFMGVNTVPGQIAVLDFTITVHLTDDLARLYRDNGALKFECQPTRLREVFHG